MKAEMFCSFCRKPASEVAKMVGDPTRKVFICDECIKVCYTVVSEDEDSAE
jgi:ATP-dependent protease Clp ATPase subunit